MIEDRVVSPEYVEDEEIIKVETFENKIIDFYDLSQGTKKFLMIMIELLQIG